MEIHKSLLNNYSNNNSEINKNSKNSENYATDSFFSSSNNLNSCSSTINFKTYKLRCVSFNNTKNPLYDVNMIDSPGYTQPSAEKWLDDISKYINNRVNNKNLTIIINLSSTRNITTIKKIFNNQ